MCMDVPNLKKTEKECRCLRRLGRNVQTVVLTNECNVVLVQYVLVRNYQAWVVGTSTAHLIVAKKNLMTARAALKSSAYFTGTSCTSAVLVRNYQAWVVGTAHLIVAKKNLMTARAAAGKSSAYFTGTILQICK